MECVSVSDLSEQLSGLGASANHEIRVGCRAITVGDELQLTSTELISLRKSSNKVRRASGAARIVARRLLAEIGAQPFAELTKSASGAPQWPKGYIGSLAHDQEFAVVAVARSRAAVSIGIDVEPAIALPEEIFEIVATSAEREQLGGSLLLGRLLFCIKEAVYKATNPVDGVFLEHHDVEVCMKTATARTRSGWTLRIHASNHPRLLALAVLPV
jgi:4'-phosphopantetheinyl transferase EntD